MIGQISANDLKVKGISAIDDLASENDGVVITVRGKEKYVVLSMEKYGQLRELELDSAIREARQERDQGLFTRGSVEDHLKRIRDV